jgi:hypothetical protein
MVGNSEQDPMQTTVQPFKDEPINLWTPNFPRITPRTALRAATKKARKKLVTAGEVVIRIEPQANGAFAVLSEYKKDHILDGRRKYAVSVSSVDEALETVANFEKYLLPEMARPAIQATPVPRMRLR